MKLIKRQDGWYVVGVEVYELDGIWHNDCGPYTTKSEAESDLRGLRDFYKRHSEWILNTFPRTREA